MDSIRLGLLKRLRAFAILLIIPIMMISACTDQPAGPSSQVNGPEDLADHSTAIWAVDFIRLLPDGEELYLRNIRENWAQAREIALANGDVLSFNALIAEPDSGLGWDIMLMTEYADSARWADREVIFRAIFDSDAYTRVDVGRPSSELRGFVNAGAVLHPVVSDRVR